MKRWQSFISLTLLGGLGVVLPLMIFIALLFWLFGVLGNMVSPVSGLLGRVMPVNDGLADLLAILIILGLCFAVGLLVKTQVGQWMHRRIDAWLTRMAPGYRTIREVVAQVLGGDENSSLLRGQVCRAWILGRGHPSSCTGIVTAKHEDGGFTVYIPTAPVPSSGLVYHLPAECVELLPHVSVEEAMRTVIACGAGSQVITRGVVGQNVEGEELQPPDSGRVSGPG